MEFIPFIKLFNSRTLNVLCSRKTVQKDDFELKGVANCVV